MWVTPERGMKFQPLFESAGTEYEVPPQLLSRLAFQESSYNPLAHNKGSNAQGLMQVVPRWHPDLKDPFDPSQAIPYSAKYLAYLKKRFGTWDKALAAYNWGEGNLKKCLKTNGDNWLSKTPIETQNYVTNVCKDTGLS